MEEICQAIYDETKKEVRFESAETKGLTLSHTIEDDKRYGRLEPANGKYFTYRIMNDDLEFSKHDVRKAVEFAHKRWRIYTKIPPLKEAKEGQYADLKLEFSTVETDPRGHMKPSTIMYMYYPIASIDNPNRGYCVINKAYFFTHHGNKVKGSVLQQHGIKIQYPNGDYNTMDFDVVLTHEFGHGELGLPHDSEPDSMMSTPYSKIAEMPSMRDQVRGRAKFGIRRLSATVLRLWLGWTRFLSEGY